jgi:uncharacterized membrane protein YfcA
MLAGRAFPLKSDRLAYIPVGLLSGFLNGSISMSGPPVALFLSNQNIPTETFRANITLYAILLNLFTLVTFLLGGLLSHRVLFDTLCLVPCMLAGVALGIWAVPRISQPVFRKMVLCLILATALWQLWSAVKTST